MDIGEESSATQYAKVIQFLRSSGLAVMPPLELGAHWCCILQKTEQALSKEAAELRLHDSIEADESGINDSIISLNKYVLDSVFPTKRTAS